jgi:hypothetical protein
MSQAGRLAFRIEGDTWVAYYALPDTMAGAIFMGSIKMLFVQDQDRKRAFMDLMKSALGDFIEGEVESWTEQLAPEAERAGNA